MPVQPPKQVEKRDGRLVSFKPEKITVAIWKAAQAIGGEDKDRSKYLCDRVVEQLAEKFGPDGIPTVEEIQDIVEKTLIEYGHAKTAKAYILYRDLHNRIRDIRTLVDVNELIGSYLDRSDWRVKENANMAFSLQGLNIHVSSAMSARYWLNTIYSKQARDVHTEGAAHIHDLYLLAPYCCGWDLQDLLLRGFGGVRAKIESRPPKHFRVALGQLVNFLYTLQGEGAGAQAVSNLDTLIAPFIRYDDLSYYQVKQAMQEFIYNMNVPTRVGFQCVSEDTEILTSEGWKGYNEVEVGSSIKTYNLDSGVIEDQEVEDVFRKEYQGKMYRLQNRIQDQLVSPGHRVVRRKFNSDQVVLEPVEEVEKLESPFIIPIAAENNLPDLDISNEQIKLMAWIAADGTIEQPGAHRCCYRVSVYQSKVNKPDNYWEIKELLDHFEFEYSTFSTSSLGDEVERFRLNAESSKEIHSWFGTKENVHFIPERFLRFSKRQARLFLDTYLKADGFEDCKIATTNIDLLDGLQALAVSAGYGFTVLNRGSTDIGSKDVYVLRLIRHKETYINDVEEVDYEGIIWCPHTKNETIIARRKGKVFITGNTPFTNVTMDLKVPSYMKDESVIIGGEMQDDTYGDFQEEMDMFNCAFAEVMMEGDSKGRVFTFPIPTYNITEDFEWDNPNLDSVWEMTAKYGIPYFSNFVNSDMDPEDARSMCCRLRLDNRELRKRGGGLFGANPLTGSIGVFTINLPRIGYLADSKEEIFEQLENIMQIGRESLKAKRRVVEEFTEKGLYPYSRHYLDKVKERYGEYWRNHFNTIGLVGGNEMILNFLGEGFREEEARKLLLDVLNFMHERLIEFQAKDDQMYNLEATPAESTCYRLAKKDKEMYKDIVVANEEDYKNNDAAPYYTNSTQLPVGFNGDVFEALEIQDPFQTRYTGGTVFHTFLGEKMPSIEATKKLVRRVAQNYELPYYTLTPTFSICPEHGYLKGEHIFCPKCKKACEVYSRVVGYLRPVNQWNDGKQAEYSDRREFDV